MKLIFGLVVFVLTSLNMVTPAFADGKPNSHRKVEFSIPTSDGVTEITGQIDVPECGQSSYPSVLIVGGTGLFYRNGYFGKSGSERDFLFLDLAKRFTSACIATIRFDYRGVSCDLTSKAKYETCLNQEVRLSVSDETKLEDLATIYNFASNQSYLQHDKIFLMGHSEGSLNISRLVSMGKVQPKGILFFGGITESAKSILQWQIVDRTLSWAFEMDLNSDGTLTNEEIKKSFDKSQFAGVLPVEGILSPEGSWTPSALTKVLESQYSQVRDEALSKKDADPHLSGGIVFTSSQWWKRWFVDENSVLFNLRNFSGPIRYHNGDIDSQAPAKREFDFLNSTSIDMASKPTFVIHKGKGHGLGDDQLYGPIDDSIAEEIVSDIQGWIK